jgi:hypothetical protein
MGREWILGDDQAPRSLSDLIGKMVEKQRQPG